MVNKSDFIASDMKSLTSGEAIFFGEGGVWENWTHEQRFVFQMNQELLCMPFDVFHEAATKTLNRDVYTHEFAWPQLLWDEYRGKRPTASMEDIINLIPEYKRIVIGVHHDPT